MKWKRLVLVILLGFVCIVLIVAGLTLSGRLVWFFRVRGAQIEANGELVKGYLHRSSDGATFYLTRNRKAGPRESYRIGPVVASRATTAATCMTWVAPALPAFPVNRYEPPCWSIKSTASGADIRRSISTVSTTASSLQFSDPSGVLIKATWR